MKKDNKELKEIIMHKGPFDAKENERIYLKFFKDWQKNHEYIHKKFNIGFEEKILDIGCNYGHNLIHFSEDSLGIEAESKLANFAQSLGLRVISMNAEDDLTSIKEKFDLIWCTDFLVHLVSPYKFLYDCRSLLGENGRIIVQIPLLSMFNMHKSPCHFYAFDKKALCYLLEMAGYEVIKASGLIRKMPRWFNFIFEPILQRFGGNIWVLAQKREVPIDPNKVFYPKWFKI